MFYKLNFAVKISFFTFEKMLNAMYKALTEMQSKRILESIEIEKVVTRSIVKGFNLTDFQILITGLNECKKKGYIREREIFALAKFVKTRAEITFRLRKLMDIGQITKIRRGWYVVTDRGRDSVGQFVANFERESWFLKKKEKEDVF